jgi:hypothetical protein
LGDSKWLWINMASMYENVCGNSVGGVELTFQLFHMGAFDFFIPLYIDLTFDYELSKKCQLFPTYRVATYIFVHSCHIYPQP